MNKLDIYLFADDSIIIEIKPEYDGNELSKLYKDLTSVNSLLESVSKKPLFDYKSLKFDLSKSIGAEIKDVQNLMDKIRAKEMFPGDGKEISSLMKQINMGANGYQKVMSSEPNQALMQSYRDLTLAANGYQKVMSSTEASSNTINQFKSIVAEANGYQKITKSAAATTEQMNAAIHKVGLDLGNGKVALKLFTDDIKALGSALNNTKSTITNASSGIRNFTSSLSNTFKRILPSLGIPTSIAGITSAVKKAVTNTASYEESLNLFTMAVGEFTKEGRQWANTISEALYLDDSQILQYTGSFYNLTKGLGVANKQAFEMSKNLTQLSYDMSSYLNIDVSVANNKLMSAMSGQTKAVTSVGIAVQSASLQQLAYQYGIKKSVESMTQAEKTYLRYIQIMRSTTQMQGDLARTIITPTNAFRMLETQVIKLGRAIGQVLTPIIYNVLPALIALTNVLSKTAKKLAETFGYEMQDIDYSAVDDSSKAVDKLGKSASGTGKKLHEMLAPFDELNVVQNESNGSGGGSAGITDKLSGMVDGYDMLEGLNKKMSASIKDWEKKIENLLPILKTLFNIWLGSKVLKKIISFINGVKNVGKAFVDIGKKTGLLSKEVGKGKTEVGLFKKAFTSINDALVKHGTSLARVSGTIGTTVASIYLGVKAGQLWADTTEDSTVKALALNAGILALGGAAYALTGPLGAVVTVLAGGVSELISYSMAMKKLREEEEIQKAYGTLFDNQGVSIRRTTELIKESFEPLSTYNTTMDDLISKHESAKTKVDESRDALEKLHAELQSSSYEENSKKLGTLKQTYDDYTNALVNQLKTSNDIHITNIKHLQEEGTVTVDEAKKMSDAITNYNNLRVAQTKGYGEKLAELDAKLATNKISQSDYNEELRNMATDYQFAAQTSDKLTLSMGSLKDIQLSGFDLESPEKFNDALKTLIDSTDDLKKTTTETYTSTKEQIEGDIKYAEQQITNFKLLHGNVSTYTGDVKKQYDILTDALKGHEDELKKTTDQYTTDMNSISGTQKDVLLTLLGQINLAGLESNSLMADSVSLIKGKLGELANVDFSESDIKAFTSFIGNGNNVFGKWSLEQIKKFEGYGVTFSDEMIDALLTEADREKYHMEQQINSSYGSVFNSAGEQIPVGISNGATSKVKLSTDAAGNIVTNFIGKLCDNKNGLGDKNMNSIGSSTVKSFTSGMTSPATLTDVDKKTNTITNKVYGAMNTLKTDVEDTTFELKFEDNSGSMFNAAKKNLQSFTDTWTNSTNKLMSNMKTSMNGITVKDGKISYTKMPKLDINKYADGGFPTKGDYFIANEAGPEFVGKIGNRTAVANNDQITAALTNALMDSLSSINLNNEPGITQVYIGNDKVYEGQGTYQNRQSDRYGTSVIKV